MRFSLNSLGVISLTCFIRTFCQNAELVSTHKIALKIGAQSAARRSKHSALRLMPGAKPPVGPKISYSSGISYG